MLSVHKQHIANRFSKAAAIYTQHNRLQQQCAEQLQAWLRPELGVVLDAGCGPAVNTQVLHERADTYVGFDLSAGMLAQAQQCFPTLQWVQGDIEQVPFAASSIDTLFMNLAVQWVGDLRATLGQLLHCLKPRGQVVLSTILDGSMAPLGTCFKQVTGHPHHNQFMTEQQLHLSLADLKAQFADSGLQTRVEIKPISVSYLTLRDMLYDLKGIGANYQPRGQQPLTRAQLRAVEQELESFREADWRLPLNWKIAFVELLKG